VTTPRGSDTVGRGDPLKQGQLAQRSVYFDYDSNSVKDEYRGLVQAHSRYLTADKRDAKIRIEGNCDERGSREYNLALGQRRAEAVKKVMTVLGVQDGRIETVSFGEEKPAAMAKSGWVSPPSISHFGPTSPPASSSKVRWSSTVPSRPAPSPNARSANA